MEYLYPGGLPKAMTFSYDDGHNLLRAAQRTDFPLLQGSEELHLYFVVVLSVLPVRH